MTSRAKGIIWIIGVLLVCLTSLLLFFRARRPRAPKLISLTGVVLTGDRDPRKEVAISNATVLATVGGQSLQTRSDPSGLFRLSFSVRQEENPTISLAFQAEGHQPLLLSDVAADRLLIARMAPENNLPSRENPGALTTIAKESVRVRYTTKMTTSTNVGALVDTFEAINTGNIPCGIKDVCSPDGKWKATVSPTAFEAGTGNQFLNARVSCIAGPCPFTRLEASNLSDPGSTIRVSVRNWSDTATFLVEAEVSRIVHGDVVRQSVPAIFGPALSFTLPSGAEGPSIQAEVNGTSIVFPLGPEHELSWATCNLEIMRSGTQVFRCELKSGYQFR
ncbi:MAG: hypothetical protein JO185_27555 [Acidobacteriaceae bacterium]|nr:hypothetical protein [Acidobacteriaceae bacterium]